MVDETAIAGRRIVYVTDGIAPSTAGGMAEVSRRHIAWLADAGAALRVVYRQVEGREIPGLLGDAVAVPWPEPPSFARLNPWNYVNQLRRFGAAADPHIRDWQPELVYCEGPLLDTYLGRPRADRAPAIYHPHGLNMYQRNVGFVPMIRRLPLRKLVADHIRRAERTISQGGQLTALLGSRAGAGPAQIALLPNTLSEGTAMGTVRSGHRRRFAFLGRDDRLKGLRYLLETFPGDADLLVIGVDEPRGWQRDNIRFAGEVRDRAEINRLLGEADFLVVPSLSEGMPTGILEAFALGLPAIASDVGAVAELVLPGKTGWLVPPGETTPLRAALRSAMSLSASDYAAMSSACLALVQSRFSPAEVRAAFVGLCLKTIEEA